jgi:class 3 adenylate cyclase/tetratricopeptide (TPR) repeat protein
VPSCPACADEVAAAARFCPSCGTPQTRSCSACGAATSGRFCAECGTPVGAPQAAPAAAAPATRVSERRVTSVLFGDLVGFTTLSESRDPEEVRELLSRYFATARTVIERYGGTVEKFIGDAVMAVWGVPVAMEDDAERAVRAGLDLVAAVVALGEEVAAAGLTMRVGVVTGEVAVTLGATGEGMVAGDAVNTAARVQSAANPGEVWVDEETKSLTSASVSYVDAGTHQLKGKREPMALFAARQVIAVVGGSRRVDGLEAPFVGRDRDLRLVKELFHATLEERRPRLVSVIGAAGMGKSRVGWEFDKYSDGITNLVAWHRGRCLAYGEGVAFWALAEMLRMRIGSVEGEGPESLLERLREALPTYVTDAEERDWLLPRLATLLGVGGLTAPETTFARDDLFAAWRVFFERLAESSEGCVLVVEDLQWADDGLLDFFEYVVETAQSPIFILTFARPELAERRPRWGSSRRTHALHLEPLPDAVMSDLVDGLVDGLPAATRAQLVARADGVPLYAVETVRALIDRDAVVPRGGRYVMADDAGDRVDLEALAAPTSLHTLIAARLDALPPAQRRLVQDASVLGQVFTRAGLAALLERTEDVPSVDVEGALADLVRKEILAVESDVRSPERGQYRFVQALVRTVAYETLSRHDRKARHLAATKQLEADEGADTLPAILANHYIDAKEAVPDAPDAPELTARARELLERAAISAIGLGAPAEARRHYESALALADTDADRGRLAEGAARCAMQMANAPDAMRLADLARDAYLRAGLRLEAARAVAVWGGVQNATGSPERATKRLAEAYEEIRDLPGAEPVAAALSLDVARSMYMTGVTTPEALQWFDRAVMLAESLEDYELLVSALSSYGGALIIGGRPTMGLGLLRVALDVSRQHSLLRAKMWPLNNLVAFTVSRDLAAARTYAEEGIALVRRLGDRSFGAFLNPNYMAVLWLAGDWDAAIQFWTQIRDEEGAILGTDLPAFVFLAQVRAARGEPLGLPHVEELAPGSDATGLACFHHLLTAFARNANGDVAGAAAEMRVAVDNYLSIAGIDDDFPVFWVNAVETSLASGETKEAARLIAIVTDAPYGNVSTQLRAQLPRLQAMLAIELGDDDVGSLLDQAEARLREFGAPFFLAQTLLTAAEWHARNGDAARARPLLDEAQKLFVQLRARPWIERATNAQTLVVT